MTAITKEFLDSLPEKDILMIRDYIWTRFGTGPAVRETVPPHVGDRRGPVEERLELPLQSDSQRQPGS